MPVADRGEVMLRWLLNPSWSCWSFVFIRDHGSWRGWTKTVYRSNEFSLAAAAAAASTSALVLIAFHKPFGVLSQFTTEAGSTLRTLAEFGFPKDVYPIGRLDGDSEGLLLLSDEPQLNERLLHPQNSHEREYWVQVERVPTTAALEKLASGLLIQGRKTLPSRAWLLEPQPQISPRVPPIRFRKNVSDYWIGLELVEGKNRQVRRMTAAVGHPTLRLLRVRIGKLELGELKQGDWKNLTETERKLVLS